jgi:hypothetical protein
MTIFDYNIYSWPPYEITPLAQRTVAAAASSSSQQPAASSARADARSTQPQDPPHPPRPVARPEPTTRQAAPSCL